MNLRHFQASVVGSAIIVAAFSGCAMQSAAPVAGGVEQSARTAGDAGRSWMVREARAIKRLLYSGDQGTNNVNVYDYDTGVQVGMLTGFTKPEGLCVDAEGDIYVTSAYFGEGEVIEYKHGGAKPIETLQTDGAPVGCSVNAHGDLAVANNVGSTADVQVWKSGSNKPEEYSNDSECYQIWAPPGYDDKGNLFMQTSPTPGICELPADGKALVGAYLDRFITGQGSVMWDGKYMTFTITYFKSGFGTAIYQTREHGDHLIVVHTSRLDDHGCWTYVPQAFVVGKKNTPVNHEQGTVVVGGSKNCSGPSPVEYWKYPESHSPFDHVHPGSNDVYGVAVSIAQ